MEKEDKEDFLKLLILGSTGLVLVACSTIGFLIGFLIDRLFNISPLFTIIFLILGTIGGIRYIYRLIKRIFAELK